MPFSTPPKSPRPPFKLPQGVDLNQLAHLFCLEQARRNLFNFTKLTAPPEYNWGHHHAVLYRYLNDFAFGRRKRIIIEMPPRHGKSEGTSRRLPPFLFGHFPDMPVVLASHTSSLAEEMARDVRQIMDGDLYRQIFPAVGIRVGKRDRDRADLFDISGGGSFKAVGVGSGLSGRGFRKGIIDDYCKDRTDANSFAFRESVWRWFTSVFYKRQAKDAGILITSTRWHEDDLIGRLKKKIAAGESEPYDILTLPSLATDNPHPDDWRKPGEALWPWFKTAEQHEQTRLLEPRDFAALDQQDPRSEGGTEWPSTLFPSSIWFDEWPKDAEAWVIACDPSKGKSSKHGDYSALVAVARDRDGVHWVEADLARRPVDVIIAATYEMASRIRRELGKVEEGVGFETDGFQELLMPMLRAYERGQAMQLRLHQISHGNVPKKTRIRRLTPLLTAGRFRFRATPSTRLLVRQMEEFPVGDHDDGPDSAEMAIRLINRLYPWGGDRN